ncbi:MAG: UDP-N-acetylmuramoyl-L-alanyl-D-glutamate--2,6-diaminopimelate ligase [Methylococcales bacterium]|nr:UDP-N-acetylmuramoyl-L-alanyl-D-glutamate--2,6-diaminopimelate ligase [Methylococcales bacterium]MCK5926181.1 UDP-N-acetylmuramoyl-L-alanyl-D-glutamate--2,6-diaminopimelate ligase [Methylococcales bacterium]
MKLNELIAGFSETSLTIEVSGLSLNSADIKRGDVFVALSGEKNHGLKYAQQVVDKGAQAIFYEPCGQGDVLAETITNIPLVRIEQLESKLSEIAARFHHHPSKKLAIIGITGTNGKTSCSQFLAQMLTGSVSIGTLGWGQWGKLKKTQNTTPTALILQSMLAQCVVDNNRDISLEVSSHAIVLGRINSVAFEGAIFTNLSQDHLDFHGTMEAYFQAKLCFLKDSELKFAVINLDDKYSQRIIESISDKVAVWTFSCQGKKIPTGNTVVADAIELTPTGLRFNVVYQHQKATVCCPFYGRFNVENILAVITALVAKGVSFAEVTQRASLLMAISGRMERFGGDDCPQVFVDYAHTPDALLNALSALKQHQHSKVSVVFGCGGNRDAGKRAQMGRIACENADQVIITDDNPRYEMGKTIIENILTGCASNKVCVINNRQQAIETVIRQAEKEECILIAGKGHENYQEINGIKHSFSDQAVVKQVLQEWVAKKC